MCATGIWIKRTDWSQAKQSVKPKANSTNKDLINAKLRLLETTIADKWLNDNLKNVQISKDWLRNIVGSNLGTANVKDKRKIFFSDWVESYVDDTETHIYKGKSLSDRTVQKHKTTLAKLHAFENYSKTKYRFENIDLKFYRAFLEYCRSEEKLLNNTIGKYIADIKKWCKLIDLEGLPINQQYKHSEFMTVSNKTKDTYLSEEEINKVFNHDFSKSTRLDNARDLFIIGLRTGLRISDFLRLKQINLKDGYIEIETMKTGEPVVIPLHHQIKSILEKRGGQLPYSISDQKFNLYVKEVCETAGINELIEGSKKVKLEEEGKTKVRYRKVIGNYPKHDLISSHTCRRSFASNLYGKLPNMVIMAITSHKTESQFLKYIKITNTEHAETLKKHWANEQEKQHINE
ncbi:tyrosine-type recombinase/integrase [Planktosalinus lacus]|nr:tyrosine-type recombinase/integrase [Planktosalinus lacus]